MAVCEMEKAFNNDLVKWTRYSIMTVGGIDKQMPEASLTSALYILMRPEFTLAQVGTPLTPHNWLECSANGPVFTWQTQMLIYFTVYGS